MAEQPIDAKRDNLRLALDASLEKSESRNPIRPDQGPRRFARPGADQRGGWICGYGAGYGALHRGRVRR